MKVAGRASSWSGCCVHILFLVGFRSRVIVAFDWFWNFVTYQRGVRLISDDERESGAAPHARQSQPVPRIMKR